MDLIRMDLTIKEEALLLPVIIHPLEWPDKKIWIKEMNLHVLNLE